jgi:hypothetical protein
MMEHGLVAGMFMVDFFDLLMAITVPFVDSITMIPITAAATIVLMVAIAKLKRPLGISYQTLQVLAKVTVCVQVLALTVAITLL